MSHYNMKCIKHDCPMYFESDSYFTTCKIINNYIGEECEGFFVINDRREEIMCSISKDVQYYNDLVSLQDFIINKQNI